MTSPYTVVPTTATTQERRPSYEDLKSRAEQAGFYGGRGVMDTREWYELCYFTPLEDFLFEALKAHRPSMSHEDVAVCVSTWIYDNSVSKATYERVRDRILFVDEPGSAFMASEENRLVWKQLKEQLMHSAYKNGHIIAYRTYRYGEEIKEENNGQQGSGPYITPNDGIKKFLDELVWRECAENDAAIIAEHGREAFDELTEILHESQERRND
jgi:hypothetical protein